MRALTETIYDPILVPIAKAAAMIGRGKSFIYEGIGDGRFDAVKSDKRTLIVVESLRRYAASLPPAKIKPVKRLPPQERRKNAIA
jgi:hypothetical protein